VRPAVLWRKGCFGTQSAAGSRFVERLLMVSATCRQHDKHLLSFLTMAVEARWSGQPAPTLVGAKRLRDYHTFIYLSNDCHIFVHVLGHAPDRIVRVFSFSATVLGIPAKLACRNCQSFLQFAARVRRVR
jgi:hypothetical protein